MLAARIAERVSEARVVAKIVFAPSRRPGSRPDVLSCTKCQVRLTLVAMVAERASVRRYLAGVGELVDVPERSPSRGPPYWKSKVLRQKALGEVA